MIKTIHVLDLFIFGPVKKEDRKVSVYLALKYTLKVQVLYLNVFGLRGQKVEHRMAVSRSKAVIGSRCYMAFQSSVKIPKGSSKDAEKKNPS